MIAKKIFKALFHDSYGDGWNGAFIEVYINNVLTDTFSGANYSSTDTFSVCNGDTLQLFYTAGSYENENTYQLYDAAWNLLFSDGPDLLTGNVLTIKVNSSSTWISLLEFIS